MLLIDNQLKPKRNWKHRNVPKKWTKCYLFCSKIF